MSSHDHRDAIHFDEDAFADVVLGLAPEALAEPILAHTASCADCEELFRMTVEQHERGRAGARIERGATGSFGLARPHAWKSAADRSPRRFTWRRLRNPVVGASFGVALAAAAVLLVVLRGTDDASDAGLPEHWIPSDRGVVSLRGSANAGLDEDFLRGVRAYDERDATTALGHFQAAKAKDAYEDLRRIYLASSLLLGGRADDALTALEGIKPETLPEPWRTDAQWISVLALLSVERREQAELLLEELSRRPSEVRLQAEDTLGRLRDE